MLRLAYALALIAGTGWFIYLLAKFFAKDTEEPEQPTTTKQHTNEQEQKRDGDYSDPNSGSTPGAATL